MKVSLSYNPLSDCLIVFEVGRGPRRIYEDAKDAGFTFERRDEDTDEIAGYEFYDLNTYHRQDGRWDLTIEEPDFMFEIVDGPGEPVKLLALLDWAVANLDKVTFRPATR